MSPEAHPDQTRRLKNWFRGERAARVANHLSEEATFVDFVTRLYLRLRESRGQTMGEYALIVAAVAVVAFAGYKILGNNINSLTNTLAGDI